MNTLNTEQLQAAHKQIRAEGESVDDLSAEFAVFSGHNLKQQDSAALMNRIDSKYLLSRDKVQQLLADLQVGYSVLEIDDRRLFTYQNTYFDSPQFDYFRQHHNGKLNRHKVRYRRYVETDTEFLEIKFKTNKRRTIKERVLLDRLSSLAAEQGQEFTEEILSEQEAQALSPSLHVNYRRATLMNTSGEERLTLDFDLRYSAVNSGLEYRMKDLVIVENKRFGKLRNSPFMDIAKERRFKSSSFSKYCIGCCLTEQQDLKINRFKPLLKQLNPFSIEPLHPEV